MEENNHTLLRYFKLPWFANVLPFFEKVGKALLLFTDRCDLRAQDHNRNDNSK